MKAIHVLLAAALFAVPLAACGDKASAPAMEEAMVDQAMLAKFVPLLPAAPKGFTAAPATTVTGKERSVVSQTYSAPSTDAFSVEITFSNADVAKFQKMLDEPKELNKSGGEINEIAGKKALTFAQPIVTNAQYVMLVSPSRFVSVTPLFGDTLKPIMRSVFEQIDFDAIAAMK